MDILFKFSQPQQTSFLSKKESCSMHIYTQCTQYLFAYNAAPPLNTVGASHGSSYIHQKIRSSHLYPESI